MAAKYLDIKDYKKKMRMIDLSQMRMITMLPLYEDVADNLIKYNPLENTNKVLIPVTPLMLDILTESHYDEYGEETILEGIASLRDISIVVQIYWDGKTCDEDNLVYVIGIVGSFSERERSKYTLTEMIETEEEKFQREVGFCFSSRFQSRYYSLDYFKNKLEGIKK